MSQLTVICWLKLGWRCRARRAEDGQVRQPSFAVCDRGQNRPRFGVPPSEVWSKIVAVHWALLLWEAPRRAAFDDIQAPQPFREILTILP